MKTKCLNLGLVICLVLVSLISVYPAKAETTPWPPDDFWNFPYDPSIFDGISFGLYGEAPAAWICQWNFGDGTSYNECWVNQYKHYQKDGDYTVSVRVTNEFGETASASRVVSVRTHDVAITKFNVPQSAGAGQTRQLVVYVRNNRYPETVRVDLFKSTPDGYALFGSLSLQVPVRPVNRTTAFNFSYTFTADDARIGKVTFKAEANLDSVRDAWPVDNEAIALPTRVSR